MQPKQQQAKEQDVENMLRDFGVKPSEDKRDNLRLELFKEREKFLAVERLRGKDTDRDMSR